MLLREVSSLWQRYSRAIALTAHTPASTMSKPCPKVNPHTYPLPTENKTKRKHFHRTSFPQFPNISQITYRRRHHHLTPLQLLCCCRCCYPPINGRNSPFTPFRFITVNLVIPSPPPDGSVRDSTSAVIGFPRCYVFQLTSFRPRADHIAETHAPKAPPLLIRCNHGNL